MTTNLTHHSLANINVFEAKKTAMKGGASGPARKFIRQPCPSSITMWVDHACAVTGIKVTGLERQQLIEALLARQHLILSGPANTGKRRLARTLAFSMAQGQQSQVRLIQGHPWWATGTGDLAYYVNLQMEYSVWRLQDFVESIDDPQLAPQMQAEKDEGSYVACIERMSPVEIDFYFGTFSQQLLDQVQGKTRFLPLRLVGTYDSSRPPDPDDRILRVAAVVHLRGTPSS